MRMKSEIFKFNVLQLSLLCAKVCNLKISIVKFSTDLQLSLLYAKVRNLKISSVMFPTDLQLSLVHANV